MWSGKLSARQTKENLLMYARIVVGALLVVTGSLPAPAQSYELLKKWCYGDATDDQTIQGCDAVIKSARETPEGIADAVGNRGLAYKNKRQLDRAMQDYDEAIRRYPGGSNIYNLRGSLYDDKG